MIHLQSRKEVIQIGRHSNSILKSRCIEIGIFQSWNRDRKE